MLKGLEQQEIYNLLSLGITDSSDNYQIAKALLKGYKITQKELFKYLGTKIVIQHKNAKRYIL